MSNSRTILRARSLSSVAAFGLAVALAGVSTPALAAPPEQPAADAADDDEIVITAQRREENMQDVPIAVAAASEEMLEDTGIQTTRDIPSLVPSVQMTRSGASGLLFIRGVGTTNAAVGEESSNSVYIDNVYMADLGQVMNNFNNIERIEVLRGPQGTLFGRNATGGLIHIITQEPGDELEIKGKMGYGNFNTVSGQFYLGGPISDNLSADIAFTGSSQANGWGRNLTLNRDIKLQDFWGLRSKIVFRPSDRIKFVLTGDYSANQDNLALAWKIAEGTIGSGGQTSPAGQNTTANKNALTEQQVWGISLTGEFDLGFATLTSVSAYRKTRNQSGFDVDGGPINLINIDFESGGKSFQQEFRLASNDTDPLAWQVGVFYLQPEATNDSIFSGLAFGANRQHILANLKTKSYAAFGELTYAVTATTKITGGLRYTKDKRSFVGGQAFIVGGVEGPFTFNPIPQLSYDAWTWRVAARQEITDDVSVYASVNRGFKSGSYSLQSPLNAPYLPHTIMAYEAGLKTQLFNRKLRLNLSGYHYKIDDYQVRSAAAANPGATLVLNAGTVKVNGIDLEFDAAPTEEWRLFGGATWLIKSEFSTFGGPGAAVQSPIIFPTVMAGQNTANSCAAPALGLRDPYLFHGLPWIGGWVTCFGNVSGNRTMNAPKLSVSLGTSYTLPVGNSGELRFTGLWNYNSGYFFEPDNNPLVQEDGYHLFNASIEYRPTERIGIELWVRNLGNAKYTVQKLSSGTGTTQALAPPRTYGVNLKYQFGR